VGAWVCAPFWQAVSEGECYSNTHISGLIVGTAFALFVFWRVPTWLYSGTCYIVYFQSRFGYDDFITDIVNVYPMVFRSDDAVTANDWETVLHIRIHMKPPLRVTPSCKLSFHKYHTSVISSLSIPMSEDCISSVLYFTSREPD
jgi:hypothetical protein